MSLRYPGGKKKVAKYLAPVLLPCRELREPFCGSGAVTIAALSRPNAPEQVWINDVDPGIAALWTSVIREPARLIERVESFTPSVEAFREFKMSLSADAPLTEIERGFRKLAVHQMSYSGLGEMAGPIGGWTQGSAYDVGCRWNPQRLAAYLGNVHQLVAGRAREDRCTSYDAVEVIQAPGEDVSMYIDPPYVGAGSQLYRFAFNDEDHERLAAALRHSDHAWLLSYDDHERVIQLYTGFPMVRVNWAYTISSTTGNQGTEILVSHKTTLPRVPVKSKSVDTPEDLIGQLFAR